jgi:hypothetical protein
MSMDKTKMGEALEKMLSHLPKLGALTILFLWANFPQKLDRSPDPSWLFLIQRFSRLMGNGSEKAGSNFAPDHSTLIL